jgi:hypothetical protein
MSQGKLSGNPSARSRVRQRIPVRGTWPWLGKWIDRVAESWARFARLRPAGAHGHGSTRFASSARDKHRRAAFRREASRGVGGWPARRLLQLALLDGPRARGARVRSPSILSCVGVSVVYGHQMFKPLAVLALHRLLHSDLSLGSSITWHVDLDALEKSSRGWRSAVSSCTVRLCCFRLNNLEPNCESGVDWACYLPHFTPNSR